MKHYLDLETSKHLAGLGCESGSGKYYCAHGHISSYQPGSCIYETELAHPKEPRGDYVPVYELEDLLRKENAEKIWPPVWARGQWQGYTSEILDIFQFHPDTWNVEVKKLILG